MAEGELSAQIKEVEAKIDEADRAIDAAARREEILTVRLEQEETQEKRAELRGEVDYVRANLVGMRNNLVEMRKKEGHLQERLNILLKQGALIRMPRISNAALSGHNARGGYQLTNNMRWLACIWFGCCIERAYFLLINSY